MMGRKAATVPSFAYSKALEASNLTWDRATLDRWLEKPNALVPGNTMAFAGIANPKDRAALIVYLEAETKLSK
jgi:cytochrome c